MALFNTRAIKKKKKDKAGMAHWDISNITACAGRGHACRKRYMQLWGEDVLHLKVDFPSGPSRKTG